MAVSFPRPPCMRHFCISGTIKKGRTKVKLCNCQTLKASIETEGRFQLTRHEVFEMHLFDEDAAEEQALCGKDTDNTERRGVRGYLEDRLCGNRVGTVCQDCEDRDAPFTRKIIDDLEADERLEEAHEYRLLADRLAKERGQDDSRGWE